MSERPASPWTVWGVQERGDSVLLAHEDGSYRRVPVEHAAATSDLLDALRDIAIAPCMAELLGRPVEDEPCWCPGCRARAAIAKAERR